MSTTTEAQLLSKMQLKETYSLTDALIARIGEPDRYAGNTHGRDAAPTQLFSQARVERWIAAHGDEMAASARRRLAARQGTETRRATARAEVEQMLNGLVMYPVPRRRALIAETRDFLFDRYRDFDGFVSDRALRAHIRHTYTNYEEICAAIRGKVGTTALYWEVRDTLDKRMEEAYADVLGTPTTPGAE